MRRFKFATIMLMTLLAGMFFYTHITAASGTQLQALAASMQPGSWATLLTNNIDATLGPTLQNGSSFNILAEGPKMVWDPKTQQIVFFGSDHRDLAQFVSYNASTNTWQRLARASWMPTTSDYNFGMMHAEDHNAIDAATGTYWFHPWHTQVLEGYNTQAGTWTQTAPWPTNFADDMVGMDFFPERRSLVIVDPGGGNPTYSKIREYNVDTHVWTERLMSSFIPGTVYTNCGVYVGNGSNSCMRNFVTYNPVYKVVVFTIEGFGDKRMWKMDASGSITRLHDAPVGLGIMCPCDAPTTMFLADPVTGDYLVIVKDTKQMWRYDVVSDTWTQLSVQIPASVFTTSFNTTVPNTIFSVSAATISDLGLQMFVSCDHISVNGQNAASCRVNLFKYAAGTATVQSSAPSAPPAGDTTPPSVSISLPASGPTISGTVNVTANASDNVGVAGVQFKLDGNNVGAEVLNAPYTVSWKTSLTSDGSHTLTAVARDAAGNSSTSAPVTVTVSNAAAAGPGTTTTTTTNTTSPSGGSDFASRCAAAGVVRCVGFDQSTDISGGYGSNSGTFPSDNPSYPPMLDSTVKASGNSSLKFTIPSQNGTNMGSYFTNFSTDLSTQFGQNSEFYVQWRQRFSPEFLSTLYNSYGWKQSIIGTGDQPGVLSGSCTALEIVTQNDYLRGFPQMYNSCTGSTSHGAYDPFEQPFGRSDFKLQNARPSPYCLYSQENTNPVTYFSPAGNCFGYFANEWMTFQIHIKMGPRVNDEFTNSYVQLWVAREGQPSELVINWGPYSLSAGSATANQQYGKIWLLPYQTNKDATQVTPTAYTWYDELIISRNQIADPAAGSTTTISPTPPVPIPPVVPFDFSLSLASSGSVTAGQSVSYPVAVNLISGTTQSASLSVSGAPSGTTVTLSATSCNPSCTSTLTLATSASTPAGSYSITVKGTSGSLSHSATLTLTVAAAPVPFDFSLSLASSGSVTAGQSVSYPVAVNLISGTTQSVLLSDSGAPSGTTVTLSPASCNPGCMSTLTLATSTTTPAGSYPVTVKGTSGSLSHTASLTLTVTAPTPTFGFSVSIAGSGSAMAGQSVSYPVTVGLVSGTTQAVSLSVSGVPSGVTAAFSASSCNPNCASNLTLATSSSTPAGSYTVTVTVSSGSLSHLASTTLTVTTATATLLTSGLIGYWPFDEGAGLITYDASGNGNSGILYKNPVWTTGKVGNALLFKATDKDNNDDDDPRVVIGKSFDVPQLPFTLTAWVNPVNYVDWRAIFSKRDAASASRMRFDVGLTIGTGQVYLTTFRDTVTFNYAPPLNYWTHIAVLATSSDTELYVNGVLRQTVGRVRLGTDATANTVIGGTGEGPGGDNDPFNGIIDEVRIYNRALSASEVQQVYTYTKQ